MKYHARNNTHSSLWKIPNQKSPFSNETPTPLPRGKDSSTSGKIPVLARASRNPGHRVFLSSAQGFGTRPRGSDSSTRSMSAGLGEHMVDRRARGQVRCVCRPLFLSLHDLPFLLGFFYCFFVGFF
jgi:hypothetical protein